MMCLILAFISVYIGIKSDDVSLNGGKNIVNFIFLYFIGHGIKMGYFVPNFTLKTWILVYLVFNVLECAIYILSYGHGLAGKLFTYGWGYNTPLLIVNAVLFFIMFTKLKMDSSFISSVARSVFPVYLIHSNLNIQNVLWPIVKSLSYGNLLISNLITTVVIMLTCILIDKILSPCYHWIAECFVNRINYNRKWKQK